jgi:hypothetical protein
MAETKTFVDIPTNERKRELKRLGKFGAIKSPFVHENTSPKRSFFLVQGPSETILMRRPVDEHTPFNSPLLLAKMLASGDAGMEIIAAALSCWEMPQALIFAKTLAKATSNISLKKAAASAMGSHPHGKEFVPILAYQERTEAAVLALVEHGDDSHVFNETSRLEKEAVDAYMAGVLAESLMSVASLCKGGRADLFRSVASSISTRVGMARNN